MTAAAAGSRTVLVAAAAAVLAVPAGSPALVHVAVVLWELGRGCAPTLLQTAAGEAAGDEADAAQGAQAMLVTLWNAAMAGGGVVGGVLLDTFGSTAFPWSVLVLLLPVATVVAAARAHGFPARSARVRPGDRLGACPSGRTGGRHPGGRAPSVSAGTGCGARRLSLEW